MKKVAIITLLLIVSACSKSEDSKPGNSIFGKWELYSLTEGGYDEFDGTEIYLPTFEFISPNTFRLIDYSYDGDFSDYIGTFSLAGNILTLNTTSLNGDSYSETNVFVDVVITSNNLVWGQSYDDGYDSGYLTYHFRKVN